MIIPVILSGGMGTRLWPMSRADHPKQLQPLAGSQTMIQATASRLAGITGFGAPLVVCNQEHRFVIAEQLREIGVRPASIILEPLARNTAPAIAVAALAVEQRFPGSVMVVLPADHTIRQLDTFRTDVAEAARLAEGGDLVTLGIRPDSPNTGYGYIETGDRLGPRAFKVRAFREKPDLQTAKTYISSGKHFWNSGMFIMRADACLREMALFHPEILSGCREAIDGAASDLDFQRLSEKAFSSLPSNSFDYAVMEKTAHASVIPVDLGWSDVGAWDALWDIGEKDDQGNVMIGNVVARASRNSYLRSEHSLLAAVGVDDLVVVDTGDAILVTKRGAADALKDVVADLARAGRCEVKAHRRVYRPWGYFESLDSGERFQVKRLWVKPGGRLSLQRHAKRAEHWVVVSGQAKVTRGTEVILLDPNQSTYIPLGTAHRLENANDKPLEIIEVQSGDYLGEDDIERLDDVYGRDSNR